MLCNKTDPPLSWDHRKKCDGCAGKELNMPKGVIVMQTEEGSGLPQKNGIQPTDVITALDDSEVESRII